MSSSTRKIGFIALVAAPIILIAALFVLGNNGVGPFARKAGPEIAVADEMAKVKPKVIYQCPMHPEVKSEQPGKCPICGMNLVKVEPQPQPQPQQAPMSEGMQMPEATPAAPPDAAPAKAAPGKVIYQCPMHPQVKQDHPGDCPICGMKLVPVKPPEEQHAAAGMDNMPVGYGMVNLSEQKIQLTGIKVVPAKMDTIKRTIRMPARIDADQRRIKQVQSKIQGWIDKLYVNFAGQYVNRGQALMAIYSPDLVSTEEEYLLAVRNLKTLENASPEIRSGAQDLLNAARRRLQYWDISSAQINRLEQTGEPFKNMMLFSPVRGYVTQITAQQGMQVMPGAMLYTITDLSQVWVMASVYEPDIALVTKGAEIVFLTDTYPGKEFIGKVSYIDPQLDPQSRTVTARVDMPNPDMLLKPQMYGNATLSREIPNTLVVPASAVMNNGIINVVFVQTQPGMFMPREVKVGVKTNEQAQILSGLKEGELVVVEGNFMLDSESHLRGSAAEAGGSMPGMPGMKQ